MRKGLTCAAVLLVAMGGQAFAADELMQQAQELFQPIPEKPPGIEGVSSTPAMIKLGRMLYFDPRLSGATTLAATPVTRLGWAAATCSPTSIGHQSERGGRNAPTVLNSVFNTAQFWDGRAKDLVEQAARRSRTPLRWPSPRSMPSRC